MLSYRTCVTPTEAIARDHLGLGKYLTESPTRFGGADCKYVIDNEKRPIPTIADMAATIPLREALNQGISSGNFIDTKIILYSYRDFAGRVCRPKALYANSHVLKTVPYFNDRTYTATLNTICTGSHGTASKCCLGILQRRDQETSGK